MKTVKDMSEISGISIRTLRYYDEIGFEEWYASQNHYKKTVR